MDDLGYHYLRKPIYIYEYNMYSMSNHVLAETGPGIVWPGKKSVFRQQDIRV
jgi:hypothetical protein